MDNRISTVVSIINYDLYQYDGQQTVQQTVQQKSSRLDTNNKDNKEKKGNLEEYISKYNELYKSHSQVTAGRRKQYALRLKVFPHEDIMKALEMMSKLDFFRGINDRHWVPNPDYLLQNDEKIDRILNPGKVIAKTTNEEVKEWLASVGADPNSI
jgi:hypothetical protein